MTADAEDVARLKEQAVALQRQLDRLQILMSQQIGELDRLTDAKFITFRTLIDSRAEQVKLALDASEKAIGKAETATEKRFDSVNEFRQQLNDQTKTFIPRSEHAVELRSVEDRMGRLDEALKTLQIWQGNITGRIAILGAVFAVFITIVVFLANYLTSR